MDVPPALADLPLLISPSDAAKQLGLSTPQVRGLMDRGLIPYLYIGKRRMILRDSIEPFIIQNTVQQCRDETQAHAFAFSKNAAAGTSAGPKMDAAASAQRALRTASSLKPR